jgi:hypothetical protein
MGQDPVPTTPHPPGRPARRPAAAWPGPPIRIPRPRRVAESPPGDRPRGSRPGPSRAGRGSSLRRVESRDLLACLPRGIRYTSRSPLHSGRFFFGGIRPSGRFRGRTQGMSGPREKHHDDRSLSGRTTRSKPPRHRSSVVEHTLGKGEVTGSSPVGGFRVLRLHSLEGTRFTRLGPSDVGWCRQPEHGPSGSRSASSIRRSVPDADGGNSEKPADG